jgi:hypothetical protein
MCILRFVCGILSSSTFLKKDNIVVPPKKGSRKDDKYAGAFVKEPVPGLYNWVVSFDLEQSVPAPDHAVQHQSQKPFCLLDILTQL